MLRSIVQPPFLTLAAVLVVAGAAKLRAPGAAADAVRQAGLRGGTGAIRALAAVEIAVGLACLAFPVRPLALALAAAYLGFAAFTVRLIRTSKANGSCGCFGERSVPAHRGHVVLNGLGAAIAGIAVAAPPVGLVGSVAHEGAPRALLLALGVAAAAWALCLLYTALPDLRGARDDAERAGASGSTAQRLALASGSLLDRRLSRRSVISRAALVGTAFAVAPLRYLVRPESAWGIIGPGNCSGGLCNDGYTAFCCEINHGRNQCPTNTFIAGWWKCTSYSGGQLCHNENVRYYVDCNRTPGRHAGGCRCANDNCNERRVGCNHFRYGQCNAQVHGTTEVVCRLVVCKHPASIADFHCNHTYKVDNSTCGHEGSCLEPLLVQGAGGGA
ncbi:MAG: hypothetical protein QOK31_393 [Solirubrobacteraceae bacterium]|nr:hypothetical protein [Solirubrobacteraceae bacterium]